MVGMPKDVHADEVVGQCPLMEEFSDVEYIKFPQSLDLSTIYEESVHRIPIDVQREAFNRWRRRRLAWLRKNGYNPKPCLLIFDSLPTVSRVPIARVLYNYLQVEWDTRRSEVDGVLRFNSDTLPMHTPFLPTQNNGVDCGVFMLHYVEKFFQVNCCFSFLILPYYYFAAISFCALQLLSLTVIIMILLLLKWVFV
ncbi:unnamed protein product [Trichobilharzia szidati]|nr:unnamed protein product [Trichobilharzia szidati]